MRVLLVEDDAMLADALTLALEEQGFVATIVQDVQAAKVILLAHDFAVVLLDIALVRGSGLDVLRFMRSRGDCVPVILITARDALSDRIKGLDLGADDYLTKPFEPSELFARMRALLRRSHAGAEQVLVWQHLRLDLARHCLHVDGIELRLSEQEYRTLAVLLRNLHRLVPKEELESGIYGQEYAGASNTVAVFIHALRRKLGNDLIETVHGQGYRMRRGM